MDTLKICVFMALIWSGFSNYTEKRRFKRLFGGIEPRDDEALYMASLQKKSDRSHVCGAILLTLEHLITACTCLMMASSKLHLLPNDYVVIAGTKAIKTLDEENIREVKDFRVNRRCQRNKYDMWEKNLGYIILEKAFFENPKTIAPWRERHTSQKTYDKSLEIYMEGKDFKEKSGKYCFVYGWGYTKYEKNIKFFKPTVFPDAIQKRAVHLLDDKNCEARFCGFNKKLCNMKLKRISAFCVVAAGQGEGPLCDGDAGSPLICKNQLWGIGTETHECGTTIKASVIYKLDVKEMDNVLKSRTVSRKLELILAILQLFVIMLK